MAFKNPEHIQEDAIRRQEAGECTEPLVESPPPLGPDGNPTPNLEAPEAPKETLNHNDEPENIAPTGEDEPQTEAQATAQVAAHKAAAEVSSRAGKGGKKPQKTPSAGEVRAAVQKTEPAAAPQKPAEASPAPSGDFKDKVWTPWLRPIVALVAITLITSLLLAVTNSVTKPLIEQNVSRVADEARAAVLPEATGFENITPSPLPPNITSVYRATNDVGFVIEAYAKGYGGDVPAMIGFDTDGHITNVQFLENNETPGLGKNLNSREQFYSQFSGLAADPLAYDDLADTLAGATLSTNAALGAVNAASGYYMVELLGATLQYDMPEEAMRQLMPNASGWQQLEVRASGVAGAYLGDDGTYVLVGQAQGNGSTVTVGVALSEEGIVQAIWADTSGETPGIYQDVYSNKEFMDQFVGRSDTEQVDTIANATNTSGAVKTAAQIAIDALPLAKEAA